MHQRLLSLAMTMKIWMQFTSNEVSYNNHNLWLIDDRLSFSQFISSDKSLFAIKLNKKNKKESDLLFFDSRKIYSEDNKTSYLSLMSIIEFKRPERKNYSKSKKGKENPIEQISLKPTPDGMGYFGYNSEYSCYIEVISFDKIRSDAKKRNRILFKKLCLEQ